VLGILAKPLINLLNGGDHLVSASLPLGSVLELPYALGNLSRGVNSVARAVVTQLCHG
jgi:hypothetical protein